MQVQKTVTISVEEYEELQRDQRLLLALQNSGVDNWEGYEEAMEYLRFLEEDK